jgi:hypothetical protein
MPLPTRLCDQLPTLISTLFIDDSFFSFVRFAFFPFFLFFFSFFFCHSFLRQDGWRWAGWWVCGGGGGGFRV